MGLARTGLRSGVTGHSFSQVKTLLLNAAQNITEPPLAPPSPTGEVGRREVGISSLRRLLPEVISSGL